MAGSKEPGQITVDPLAQSLQGLRDSTAAQLAQRLSVGQQPFAPNFTGLANPVEQLFPGAQVNDMFRPGTANIRSGGAGGGRIEFEGFDTEQPGQIPSDGSQGNDTGTPDHERELRAQCIAAGGTWNRATGRCEHGTGDTDTNGQDSDKGTRKDVPPPTDGGGGRASAGGGNRGGTETGIAAATPTQSATLGALQSAMPEILAAFGGSSGGGATAFDREIEFRAGGGPIDPTRHTVVGEAGPEVIPAGTSHVVPLRNFMPPVPGSGPFGVRGPFGHAGQPGGSAQMFAPGAPLISGSRASTSFRPSFLNTPGSAGPNKDARF